MTGATKAREQKRAPAKAKGAPSSTSGLLFLGIVGAVALVVAGGLFWLSGDRDAGSTPAADPGPIHVHGLGVDPADGALFIATHSGLYRAARGEATATRVGDRLQDTMGFTVVGANRFLGSGHPDLREAGELGLPSRLGLIESTDAGATWRSISLSGDADFHVLRSAGDRVYGYDASNDRLLASGDDGRTWEELDRPGPIVDIAIDPTDARRIVVTSVGGGEEGLFASRDGGSSWRRLGASVGPLAWPSPRRLFLVTGDGQVLSSSDGGTTFARRGEIGGEPAAFLADGADLYVALHDGTVKRSRDGGRTWTVRSAP